MASHLAPKSADNLNRELANLVCNLNVDRRESNADIPNLPIWPVRELSSSTRSKAAMSVCSTSGHVSTLPARVKRSRTLLTAPSHNTVLRESSQPPQYKTTGKSDDIDYYKASRFLGVSSLCGKWRVQVRFEGKRLHMGPFETEEEAARKYDEFAVLAGRPTNFNEAAPEYMLDSMLPSSRLNVMPGHSNQNELLAESNSKVQVSPMQSKRRGDDMFPRSDQSTSHEYTAPCNVHKLIVKGECDESPYLKDALRETNNMSSNFSPPLLSSDSPGLALSIRTSLTASTSCISSTSKLSGKKNKCVHFSCKAVNDAECVAVSSKEKCAVAESESTHDSPISFSDRAQCANDCDQRPEKCTVSSMGIELGLPEHNSIVVGENYFEPHNDTNFEQSLPCRGFDAHNLAVAAQPAQMKRKLSILAQQPVSVSLRLEHPIVQQSEVSSKFYSTESTEASPSGKIELSRNTLGEANEEALDLWVQCDVCEKWRLISVPEHFSPSEKWVCSMNASDPLQNYCEAPEISWKTSLQSGNSGESFE